MPTSHCSPRARGANATMNVKFEAAYGTPPGGNYMTLPFVSSSLGEEQGLIEDDLLGTGREGLDPTLDVINNDGDLTVPVDARAFGHWLTLFLGSPAASPAAVSAAGMTVTLLAQPTPDSTITINGTAFTAKASGASGNQFNIGANIAATVTALVAVLNASVVAGVAAATYAASGQAMTITHDTSGLSGNSFTVAADAGFNAKIPSGTLSGGTVKHIWSSGATCLPSMAIEIGNPEIPNYEMNYGVCGNTMRIQMARSGNLSAALGLIAKGSTNLATSGAGTPTAVEIDRFVPATGEVMKDGLQLASVQQGSVGFTNNLQKVETILPDGRIEGADPGNFRATGDITVLFRDRVMLDAATAGEPIALTEAWSKGNFKLRFILPRVFLPKPKRTINGPNGIQAAFAWQASGEGTAAMMTVELETDVASFA